MQDFCEDRHKVLAYVPTAVAQSLREIYIRAPKERVLIACLFKAELSEANALIGHCLVLCYFLFSLFVKNNRVLYLCETYALEYAQKFFHFFDLGHLTW